MTSPFCILFRKSNKLHIWVSSGRSRFERSKQRRVGAEASNEVESAGRIDKKEVLFTFWLCAQVL